MSPTEFKKLAVRLMHAYPRQAISEGTLEEFQRGISDLEYRAADLAVSVWIRGSRWFPTIADIRDVTLGQPTPMVSPSEEERAARRAEVLRRNQETDEVRYRKRVGAMRMRYGAIVESGNAGDILALVLRGGGFGKGGEA